METGGGVVWDAIATRQTTSATRQDGADGDLMVVGREEVEIAVCARPD